MNRLSPLIVRRFDPRAATLPARPAAFHLSLEQARPAEWLEDLKLFATGWIGGLIFFGTLLG